MWQRVLEHLAEMADNEYAMIEVTIARAHQHAAGVREKGWRDACDQIIGAAGGLSTRIHAEIDVLGNPLENSPHCWPDLRTG